jgi:hypothetical protein
MMWASRKNTYFNIIAPLARLLALLMLPGLILAYASPAKAQSAGCQSCSTSGSDQEAAKPAPPQSWNYEKGKVKARGNLSGTGAGGSLQVAQGGADWQVISGLSSGLLNDEFSLGLNLAGGWSPDGIWGLWLKLNTEITPDYVDHFQALLNLGYKISPDFRLMASLDYLNKHLETARWSSSARHDQYGAGLSLAYGIISGLDLAAFFTHYHTGGEEYGQVGEYEFIGDDNLQHYGLIYAGMRGGDYDEGGLDLSYRHPVYRVLVGLSLSQVWRSYEAMLDHAARDTESAAGRLRLDWQDIMQSGVNFQASMSREFSSSDRFSWQVGFNRQVGPVNLGLTYSELRNDQSSTDRRIYGSLSLPFDGSTLKSLAKETRQAVRRAVFKGAWLKAPVRGMGSPALKVAELVEQRVDQTIVDLNELSEGVSVSKNIMTISGLPALASFDTENSSPSSAFEAFSIGSDGTSVLVDLTKLPAPAYIQAIFLQEDGLYTVIVFQTQEGSIKVTKEGQASNVDETFMKFLKTIVTHLKRTSGFKADIIGHPEMYVGETKFYHASLRYLLTFKTTKFYEISGAGELTGTSGDGTLRIKGTKPGTFTITAYVFGEEGGYKGYYDIATKTVTVKERPKPKEEDDDDDDDEGGGDDDSGDGDTGGSCGTFRKQGDWTLNDTGGSGFFLNIVLDNSGNVISVTNPAGTSTAVTSDTGGCNNGKYNGNITCTIGGQTYSYDLNLDISGDSIQAGSQVTEYVNFVPGTTYNVGGSHVGP